jgi:hypothetical protein
MTRSNLDPMRNSANNSADEEPDTLSTPEGDAEYPPDAPLDPTTVEASLRGLQLPRGNAPDRYEKH